MTTHHPKPMHCQPAVFRRICAGLLAALCCVACASRDGAAQENQVVVCPVDLDNIQPLTMGRALLGVSKCAECHQQGAASSAASNSPPSLLGGLVGKQANDKWVRKDEIDTWYNLDRHAQAFATLFGPRSVQIGKNLGIEAHRDARCLACHSTLPAASVPREGNAVDAALVDPKSARDWVLLGVSCEACHGASGPAEAADVADKKVGWWDVHIGKDQWRYQAPADKQEEFGYYDVRTPSSRAAMCLSCHLGDARQGRLVTHAMYAAGHPPLPSFELRAFVDMMPAHWRDLGSEEATEDMRTPIDQLRPKKPQAVTADFLAKTADPYFTNLRDNHEDFYKRIVANYDESFTATRSMAIGALTAWTKNAELTRALMSTREYPLLEREARWPELSQFECSACHHELRQADWRQDENPGKPGRPMLRDWAAPLCRAVLTALAPEQAAEFDRRQREIEAATAIQPYGDRALLDQRLEESAAWLTGVLKEIETRPFGRPEALAVIRAIAAAGAERPLDYDAARQLTWGLSMALKEFDPGEKWTAVHEHLGALQQRFVLQLATTKVRGDKQDFNVAGVGTLPTYEIDLSKVLPLLANHSGREVREAFVKLAEATQAGPP